MQRTASILALLVLCLPTRAQTAGGPFTFGTQQAPVFDPGDEMRLALPTSSGARTRSIVGDFTGDARVDAILLDGSELLMLSGVAVWNDCHHSSIVANDVALAPPLSVPGPDTVVVASSAGIERFHDWDGSTFARTSLGGAEWDGAVRVLVDDAAPRVVGIAADRQNLLVLDDPFGSGSTTSIPLNSTMLDLVLLDWDGDGDRDVATIATGGLFVFEADGTLKFSAPGGVGTAVMAAFEQPGAAGSRLAAVVTWPGGTEQFLHVIDRTAVDAVMPLGSSEVHGLETRDVDADGAEDLFLVHRVSYDGVLFFNQSDGTQPVNGGTTFSFASGQLVPLGPSGTPGPGQSINPSLEDIDLDGDVDLMLFVDQDEELLLQMNNGEDVSNAQFTVGNRNTYTLNTITQRGELRLDALEPQVKVPSGATHLEVSLYELPTASGIATQMGVIGQYQLGGDWSLGVLADWVEPEMEIDKYYVLELRPLVWSGLTSTPVESGPSTLIAFTTPLELMQELQDLWGGTEEIVPVAPWILESGASAPVPFVDPEQRDLAPAVIKIPEIEL